MGVKVASGSIYRKFFYHKDNNAKNPMTIMINLPHIIC